ncbi:hypothetical protein [Legionella waltersii]|uniref:Lipoprotein n=1 Tax=Legionella waltersii TaxID=66969 RepID=A0A0W1AE13_9GAMM|nr:hypothetical protein [Legionella waltersii]KTD79408.1 hypothetical protein Lwal_1480 [Legionella waltersii]SNU97833.1 Uncharacterised protein [Legionella waltersii]
MRRLIGAGFFVGLSLFLSGCGVDVVGFDTVYDSGYSNDYVYSVGYYGNRPYWGNNYYYSTSYVGPYGYWGGDTDTY